MSDARLFALQEFCLTYLHQDWRLDDPTTADVARRFRRETEPEFKAKLVADIRDLLSRPLPEGQLHEYLLDEYSISYDPWQDDITTRAWLESLLTEIDPSNNHDV